MMTLAQARARLPGSRLVGGPAAGATVFTRVHSDTRTLRAGDLFVALRGDRFDAHDFLPQACAAGAVAALAEHGLAPVTAQPRVVASGAAGLLPGLLVDNALLALQQLAASWRLDYTGPLVAVTGSNGKTTVTQMVACILVAWLGDAALSTAGNLNNHIGVPLTLLRLRPAATDAGPAHRAAVLELGMNHAGEIARLAAWARPTVALVNNAQREHQEFMDGVQAVAIENGSVIEALGPLGTVVIPADAVHTPLWRALAGSRSVCTFSAADTSTADVSCSAAWQGDDGRWALSLHTPCGTVATTLAAAGRHNLANALAAAACAQAAGAPLPAIAAGLAMFQPVAGRSQTLHLLLAGRRVTLIDDSYNANPDSVLAAIDVLASLPGPRWLVLGDMGEVGTQGPQFHAEVGERARHAGIDHVWATGPLCELVSATRLFDSVGALLAGLDLAPVAASALVKGSRFMKMEQVVQALRRSGHAAAGQEAVHAA